MAGSKTPIELLAPLGVCPPDSTGQMFKWRALVEPSRELFMRDLEVAEGRSRIRVWEMPPKSKVATVMKRRPLLKEFVDSPRSSFRYPAKAAALAGGAAYLWLVETVDGRGRVLSKSEPGVFYLEHADLPFPLAQLRCCDDERMVGNDIAGWTPAYGTPSVLEKEPSCFGVGAIALQGSAVSGDAVSRALEPSHKFKEGKHYLVSFCARSRGKHGYARFRVNAHNGPLPTGGSHPPPSNARVPIGESARIATKEWTWVILPPWRAPRDFSRVAIAAIADSTHFSGGHPAKIQGDVADICVREVDGCDGLFTPTGAGPEISFGAAAEIDLAFPPTAEATIATLGPMADLYGPHFDGDGNDNWYGAGDECVSVGGWVPDDVEDHVPWLDPDSDLIIPDPETVQKAFETIIQKLKDPALAPELAPISFTPEECTHHDPAPNPQEPRHKPPKDYPIPFAGRDIVYIHGFVPDHVVSRIVADDPTIGAVYSNLGDPLSLGDLLPTNVTREWPTDPNAYKETADGNGFFRARAEDGYWKNHIAQFLLAQNHPNRYMVVGYNCSQGLAHAVHTVLCQIADAMSTGAGVRDPSKTRGADCFGVEYVIVSHSTGALVTQVALAVAALTATDDDLKDIYGDISGLADRAKVHISMHGAMGGSEGAQLAVVGAAAVGGLVALTDVATDSTIAGLRLVSAALGTMGGNTTGLDAFVNAWAGADAAVVAAGLTVPQVVFDSILVDLSPLITKTVWASLIGSSPVPTLTLTGGHPGALNVPTVLKLVLPGLDDGVVNANSQAGSNNLLNPDLYAYVPPADRIFDMGLPLVRSASYFVEQFKGPFAAYGAIPWLSPSGMVQPVAFVPAVPRFPNVFPFLQGSSEHSYTTDAGTSAEPLEEYLGSFGSRNYEESLVLESAAPITMGLVAPAITGQVVRYNRSLTLTVRLRVPVPRITLFPPDFRIVMVPLPPMTFPVWTRFYDLLGTGGPVTSSAAVTVNASTSAVTVSSNLPSPDGLEVAMTAPGRLGEMRYAYNFVLPI